MNSKPIFEREFYHDGRGPELQRVIWGMNGVVLRGFEYYNPNDEYKEDDLKNIKLEGVEAYSMASEEVHSNILATGDSQAAIFEVLESKWLESYLDTHLEKCKHFQIMFYDEIYDVICEKIECGSGTLEAQ
jgi:hypothetical protein